MKKKVGFPPCKEKGQSDELNVVGQLQNSFHEQENKNESK